MTCELCDSATRACALFSGQAAAAAGAWGGCDYCGQTGPVYEHPHCTVGRACRRLRICETCLRQEIEDLCALLWPELAASAAVRDEGV